MDLASQDWSGEKIKDLRLRLGWSQAELARQLGCRQQTISEWETNVYQPQNAYSRLLDRLFENAGSKSLKTRTVPLADQAMKDLKVTQIEDQSVHDYVTDNFDLAID